MTAANSHLTREVLVGCVTAAARAPSSHNTQPWLFRLLPDGVELVADRSRRLPVNDPNDRELTISCGAALLNLRVAAEAAGFEAKVEPVPAHADADLLARVRFHTSTLSAESRLLDAIDRRRTYRKPFVDRDVPPATIQRLEAAAASEGATLCHVDASLRHDIAALVHEGDRLQFADRRWRRELAAWMRPRRAGDGLTVPWLTAPVTRLVITAFNVGGRTATKDRQLAENAPLLAVLTTGGDSVADWLAAGQALERVLLEAAAEGRQASYLNQPCQVGVLRARLRALMPGRAFPQIVLRVGYPPGEVQPAPRRPVRDVVSGLPNPTRPGGERSAAVSFPTRHR